jgi:hypothetical protein
MTVRRAQMSSPYDCRFEAQVNANVDVINGISWYNNLSAYSIAQIQGKFFSDVLAYGSIKKIDVRMCPLTSLNCTRTILNLCGCGPMDITIPNRPFAHLQTLRMKTEENHSINGMITDGLKEVCIEHDHELGGFILPSPTALQTPGALTKLASDGIAPGSGKLTDAFRDQAHLFHNLEVVLNRVDSYPSARSLLGKVQLLSAEAVNARQSATPTRVCVDQDVRPVCSLRIPILRILCRVLSSRGSVH